MIGENLNLNTKLQKTYYNEKFICHKIVEMRSLMVMVMV